MSPGTLLAEPVASFRIEPLQRGKDERYNFGATITGLDLNTITDEDVEHLKEAIWTHKVVVVKGQENLDPKKHWELVTRFDPSAPQVHSHGDIKTFQKKGGMLSKRREVVGIPGAENVRLIGKGYQGPDHYGIKDLTVQGLSHDFHATDLPEEDFQAGHTRFQRWHIDAPLYDREPAWFTTLRAIKLPVDAPDVQVNWDDGSGCSLKTRPGRTAFFSNSQLYGLLSKEEQEMADCSWVEYAPYPYMWIENCKGNANGLGLATQGKEHTLEELGEYEDAKVKRYPMVWVNPVTQEKAFMVHGICARKLFVRKNATSEPTVIDDVVKIREFLSNIQSRILKPQYVLMAPAEEGDVTMWDNYGVFHSAVDYPLKYGSRTMHQANIGASRGPIGPVPIPAMS
ncbi:Clavaminate synthase-like protein [Saccharata proteae CBS 121410]|uniref:Clavaminate synthase-like protein n=1 Tax=Saccharata proteae CBS 121410 TaxID=1314787 RepID=A0A9P4I2Z4_9PEZI|nr:Clavaminate synthase-like protein [Saccharata proteae CBS 121410]